MRRAVSLGLTLILLIAVTGKLHSQIIVRSDHSGLDPSLQKAAVWVYDTGEAVLAAVERDVPAGEAAVLDWDGEIGTYYWINKITSPFGLGDTRPDFPGTRILWEDESGFLVKVTDLRQISSLTAGFSAVRLHSLSAPPGSRDKRETVTIAGHTAAPDAVKSLLDSVSQERLTRTVEELSGERSFTINGAKDSLQTRYSYSPQIYLARDYLKSRLSEMGYTPSQDAYQLNTSKGIALASGEEASGLAFCGPEIMTWRPGSRFWQCDYLDDEGRTLHDIALLPSGAACAVGSGGMILRRERESGWEPLPSVTSSALLACYALDEDHLWACGKDGIILGSRDGGHTWRVLASRTGMTLYDMYFANEQLGWAVGRDGLILMSRDGGGSWKRMTTGTDEWLRSITFSTPRRGWIAGGRGGLYSSRDQGESWQWLPIPGADVLLSVAFRDSLRGIAWGRRGSLFRTADGGTSWNREAAPPGDILSATFGPEETLWLGTDRSFLCASAAGDWRQQDVRGSLYTLYNIIAVKTGSTYPDTYYIICAHYDSITQNTNSAYYWAPGADDNGSGTAAVLEAARVLSGSDPTYSIVFALFSGEEQGLKGSAAYAARCYQENMDIAGVINMDMLGYDSNDDGLCEIHTGGYFRTMADSMMKWNSQWNLNLTPTLYTGNATTHSDHASFWNYGYQALLLIENYAWDFNAYYHSTADIVNNMNLSYFHRMSQLAIGTAAALAGVSPETSVWDGKSLPGGFDLSDPYPNPFNPSTIIRFTIPGEIGTRLEIFDMRGRRVRTLLEERLTAGTHEVFWDGRDGGGGLLPSGVYLIRCRAGEQILQKKAALVK